MVANQKNISKCVVKYEFSDTNNSSSLIRHNIFSNYIPIRKNLVVGDFLSPMFPCTKLSNDEDFSQQDNMSIEAISRGDNIIAEVQIQDSKLKTAGQLLREWLIKKGIHSLCTDIRETLLVDYLMDKFTRSGPLLLRELRQYLGQHNTRQEAFEEKLQFVQQNYCDSLFYPYGITIDDKVITDFSITTTFKIFFCHRCNLYDCRHHENKKDLNFAHPVTKLSEYDHAKEVKWIQYFYKEFIMQNKKYENQINPLQADKSPCGKLCYLNISQEILQIEKNNLKFNEFHTALIRAGIRRLSYNPCKLNLVNLDFTCTQMFAFLLVYQNILELNFDHLPIEKKIKANIRKTNKSFFNKELFYEPCCHYFYDKEPTDLTCSNCLCATRGFCDIFCGCDPSKCERRILGCKCSKGLCKSKKCSCFFMGVECDPDRCKDCFDEKGHRCKNNDYFYQRQERTVIGMSFVCSGLGLYNVVPIHQNSLVLSYLGEYVSEDEQVVRESWSKSTIFYTFTKNDYEKLVDSKYFGNKSRFMNHHIALENCFARSVYSKGDYNLGLYAKQDIPPGNELIFDYDADRTLAPENKWITRNSYSNYKIRKDNIRIIIPRNKELPITSPTVIVIDSDDEGTQSTINLYTDKNKQNDKNASQPSQPTASLFASKGTIIQ